MTVKGTDDRTWVSDTTSYPWSAIVKIEMDFDGNGTYESSGSGAMISSNDVLTAGHVLWDETYGYAKSVRVIPGQSGSSEPFGSATSSDLHVADSYIITGGSTSYDIGVINLGTDLGNSTGTFNMQAVAGSQVSGTFVNTAGYPGDLFNAEYMYSASGTVAFTSGNNMYYADTMDTYGGQSGSPVWWYDAATGTRTIVGVHTFGGFTYNGGTLLTDEFYTLVNTWTADATTSSFITGSDAAEVMAGTAAADVMYGYGGNDTLSGGAGADILYGNVGLDLILAGDGNDTVFGGQNTSPTDSSGYYRSGTETISGGAGDDVIYGNFGADSILGETGSDTLYGGQDDDIILGGDGNDVLFGNLGNDLLYGDNISSSTGSGTDTIYGGDGDDTAVYLGNQSAYTITSTSDGGVQVNGFDVLYNVEYISFADQLVAVDTLI
ncbi:MAG: trypsin-like serine protease [Alphaproteobacteria bacterium]|nr:trypsin-like serine protease [Alphaproteobacteria bacterium]